LAWEDRAALHSDVHPNRLKYGKRAVGKKTAPNRSIEHLAPFCCWGKARSLARAKEWDFTALHMEVEFGYLVPADSSISTMADVDRTGIRVAVQEKSQPDIFVSRTLKNAEVVRAPSLVGTVEMLKSRKADAIFSIKPSLFEASKQLPGSRVLEGRPGIDPHAMVLPKGRDAGLGYARQFIEDAKSGGLVKAAIDRVGMRGAVVAQTQ
jgi:polar amino acid transport system substrate-binding protein